ncbi:tetratricopeptide repeat protein [Thalassospira lucentensis]|uniref:tetratricopeptide repeat protein n=1 Tax=Thalassospira lucentensis TaxID=168935 RepID=UPI00142D76A5|nr:tetratricopeptide repeat protein [Thalassospira lucentensis]NIZ01206.1 tetratricopeptide repeat protein [Thalassospira lucentensis]
MPELIATATATSILGVVGKAAETVSKIGPVKDWLHGCKVRAVAGRLTPRNHDLVNGVRTAHICALDHVARRYAHLLTTLPVHEIGSDDRAFANNLRAFIDTRLKFLSDQSIDHDVLGAEEIKDVLEHLATATTHQSYADLNREAQADCEERALQEITRDAGRTPPALFERVFKGEEEFAGWYDAFSLFVTEELKTNERFRSIFFATEFADIRGMLNELVDQKRTEFPDLSGFMTDVKHQLDRMEDKLDKIQNSVDEKNELAEQLVKQLKKNDELSRKLEAANVTQQKVMAIARRTALNINDPDQALKELESHAEIAIEVEREGRGGSNLGAFVEAVLARVREKYDANDFDAAAAEADKGFVEWEKREAERKNESLQVGLKILKSGLKQDILRHNATSAAKRITRISELQHPDNQSDQLSGLDAAFDEWFERGQNKGLNFDLEVAIEIAVQVLESRRGEPGHWNNNLGNALSRLGMRESNTVRLEMAVKAFHLAQEKTARDRVPILWATIQNNLGNVLSLFGDRERGTAKLKEAVVAHSSALEEYSRHSDRRQWAMTQSNLGVALARLGERENSTELLGQAVKAFSLALKETMRELVPLQWARTQNNIGSALSRLGERDSENKTVLLKNAVKAFRSALEERTQELVPLQWAETQNNLGNTLLALGQRESENGTARIEEAIAAYRSALKEYRRERVPLDWAMAQNNLGNALLILGYRETGTARLKEAVENYALALQERRQDILPLQWAMTYDNQGVARQFIAERTLDVNLAKQAANQIEAAFKTFSQAKHIHNANICKSQLHDVNLLLAKLENNGANMRPDN